ncbi:MAG: hypothetical protein IJ348_01785 [Alistipes sp.]|nr:hypothetical protein [Alistipes sp.]
MMKRLAKYLSICLALLGSTLSCNVHEWPEAPVDVNVLLRLEFEEPMTVDAVIDRTQFGLPIISAAPSDYDVRYRVNAYEVLASGKYSETPAVEWTFSADDALSLDFSTTVKLAPGKYRLYAWADYVDNGSVQNKFYNADDFSAIRLIGDTHYGNLDMRDAFIGTCDIDVPVRYDLDPTAVDALLPMVRPMGKFRLVTTDLQEFVTRVLQVRQAKAEALGATIRPEDMLPSSVNFSDFRLEIRYNGWMPNEFHMYRNEPVSGDPGKLFSSGISPLSDNEAELGFDYMMVKPEGMEANISLYVYDEDDQLLSKVTNIPVPLKRSKITVIKDNFLTRSAGGGVGISPGFKDDFNIFYE